MPVVVDIQKSKQIRCFKEAFQFVLDKEYHKIVEYFEDEPKEFFQFLKQIKVTGNDWAQQVNQEWEGPEYFREVFVKYLEIMMKKNDDKSRQFVEKLIDRKVVLKPVKVILVSKL